MAAAKSPIARVVDHAVVLERGAHQFILTVNVTHHGQFFDTAIVTVGLRQNRRPYWHSEWRPTVVWQKRNRGSNRHLLALQAIAAE